VPRRPTIKYKPISEEAARAAREAVIAKLARRGPPPPEPKTKLEAVLASLPRLAPRQRAPAPVEEEEKANGDAIIVWIHRYCYVPDGKLMGKRLQLAQWQQAEIRRIYDNPVPTRRAILSFARKNGKTALCALLLLVHLCGPRARPNSHMYSTAQSREQAALIFHMAAKIIRMSPGLISLVQIKEATKELVCPELQTRYRALSAEASTAYGLSPVFAIHDELGQVRGPRSQLYEAIETATGAQEDPLSIIISTQAPTDADLLSVLIDDALAGHDPRVIVKLYTAAEHLDPFDQETIRLANPALGDFLNPVEVMAMAEDARRMPSREAEYRNLILNQRIEASMPFVQPGLWRACGGPVSLKPGQDVYAGLDLSEANDLTALVVIGKVEGVWHVEPHFWLPSEGMLDRARRDHVPYDRWVQDGFLETVPGKSIGYDRVVPRIVEILARYRARKVAFDRWNFKHLKPWLLHAGFSEQYIEAHWVEFGQGTQSMSPALRELEQRILEGEIAHGDHPVLNMCAANAVVDTVDSANRKLSKKKSVGRIDGMVALAMAIGVAPLTPVKIDVSTLIA
jgi:phage terminase large subunit-like protein